jgi:uridine phosphorylase
MAHFLVILTVLGYSFREQMVCEIKKEAVVKFPNIGPKSGLSSLYEPRDFVEYLRSTRKVSGAEFGIAEGYPELLGVIFCYQGSLFRHVKNTHPVWTDDAYNSDLLFLEETGRRIAVLGNFGIGAPVAAANMEELIALGAKSFVSLGTAGSLQKTVKVGDLVVCSRALRDEGTSHHYLDPERFCDANRDLTKRIETLLVDQKIPHHVGSTWTTDAPFRETVDEVRAYQAEGILTVEMEAAALFAVAQYRRIPCASMFSISDELGDLQWRPEFHSAECRLGLEQLLRIAVEALLNDGQ